MKQYWTISSHGSRVSVWALPRATRTIVTIRCLLLVGLLLAATNGDTCLDPRTTASVFRRFNLQPREQKKTMNHLTCALSIAENAMDFCHGRASVGTRDVFQLACHAWTSDASHSNGIIDVIFSFVGILLAWSWWLLGVLSIFVLLKALHQPLSMIAPCNVWAHLCPIDSQIYDVWMWH
jgi:hypothetical protein